MNLPGWVFILFGAFVSGYSKFVESRRDSNLAFFFWAGILFVLYGFGKEIVTRMKKPKKEKKTARPPEKKENETDHRHPAGHAHHGRSHHRQHEHVKPHPHVQHPHQPRQKRCPSCHDVTVGHARFCHTCGHAF